MQLWDIKCADPYAVKGRFLRDKNGHEVWIATLKKGWQLIDGEWQEINESLDIFDEPVYTGEPGLSSIVQDSDFSIGKSNTDVVIFGKAKSLAKRPVTVQTCRLLVEGHIDKSLIVRGDRKWISQAGSLIPSLPMVFIEKEIDLSKAIGGHDERNRLGCGVEEKSSELLQKAVPSVFYPQEDWGVNTDNIKVANFGPVPVFSQLRSQFAGTFDQTWFDERRPLFPADFNEQFYQSAPEDQQCDGFLNGGERIVLSGFSHEDALTFFLPKDHFKAKAFFKDEDDDPQIKAMNLQTVFINTEEEKITACWSAAFECQSREHLLRTTEIVKSAEA